MDAAVEAVGKVKNILLEVLEKVHEILIVCVCVCVYVSLSLALSLSGPGGSV
jgi:hypothetical protein